MKTLIKLAVGISVGTILLLLVCALAPASKTIDNTISSKISK